MKIIQCQQGTPQWFAARSGIPTASEFHRLVSPLWKIRTGDGPATFLSEKLAEKWTGQPLPQLQRFGALEQGTILEEESLPFFELKTGLELQRVGFCTTDDGRAGCSPDSLIDPDSGLECKCPQSPGHVSWLIDGVLPPEHAAQVHGCMFVTGRPTWHFLSYRRGFPHLLLTIERDEKIQKTLKTALDDFNEKFDAAWKRLCEIAGGEPKRAAIIEQPLKEPDDLWPR